MAKKEYKADPMAKAPKHVAQQDYSMPQDENNFHPRIKLIQALSPEREKGNEKFVPGAEEGMLLFEGANRLVDGDDEGVVVIPIAVRKQYAEYIPRKQGGGFVARYNNREELEAGFTQGNDVSTVIEYLCIIEDTDEVFIVAFDTVTKLGVAKKWGGYVEQYKSLEGVRYRLGSALRKNKAGQPYYNYTIEPVGWVDKNNYVTYQEMQGELEPQFALPAPDADGDI